MTHIGKNEDMTDMKPLTPAWTTDAFEVIKRIYSMVSGAFTTNSIVSATASITPGRPNIRLIPLDRAITKDSRW
jgi:hypothetical protein